MKLVLDDIYSKLSAIIPNTYFSQLPANIDKTQSFCVYEVNIEESMNNLSERDFLRNLELRVKILSNDIDFLFSKAEQIKNSIFNNTDNYSSPILSNSVPIFYDEQLELSQYTLLFNINYNPIS